MANSVAARRNTRRRAGRRMLIILAAATAHASFRRADAHARPGQPPPTLMRVVAVGRHGVKNPLPEDGTFEGIPLKAFLGRGASLPDFGGVGPGEMTPHGLELMALMGRQFKSMYARALASESPRAHAARAPNHTRTLSQLWPDACSAHAVPTDHRLHVRVPPSLS